MKKNPFFQKISLLTALCLVCGLALGCAGCGGMGAATMFLRRTEGTVSVADAGGQDVELTENLGLYSGYAVGTEAASFAWIDLDKVKLAKLDENSAAAVTKDGKNLSLDVQRGSLFFNVSEPLAGDETMEIRASSMMVGIRGTCGWVSESTVGLLEGTVTVTAGQESVTVTAGECAVLAEDGTLKVQKLSFERIPAFVARELLDDEALEQTVLEASGLRIPTTYEELTEALEGVVYSEEIDFEADGSPEVLVLLTPPGSSSFWFRIYRVGPAGPELLVQNAPAPGTDTIRYACALTERDGRLFVCCQTDFIQSPSTGRKLFFDNYYGSVAGQDGGPDDWGWTDYFYFLDSRESGEVRAAGQNENGFVDGETIQNMQQADENRNKYTLVRELYAVDVGS